MDNTKKVVRQQADVSQGDDLLLQLKMLFLDSKITTAGVDFPFLSEKKLLMKLNSYIHRRDNKMFNQGYKTAEKEMGERKDENT